MSTISEYAARLGQYAPFTPEQERVVFIAVARGDKGARDKAILHNLRLALSFAQKYIHINPEMPAEDLIQQANLGIIRAVDMFDVTRGTKFSTFAMESMQYLVVRYIKNCKNLVRVPVNKFETEVSMVDANLVDLDGPNPEEDGGTFGDIVADSVDAFESFNTRTFWENVAMALTEREAELITLRFKHDLGQAEIGERWGISKQRVHQLEKVALAKLETAGIAA